MFCLQCGKEIPDNSTVCQFCGAIQPQTQQVPVQTPEQAPQQAYQPQQAPYQAPYQGQYNAQPAPQKKKIKTPVIIAIVVVVLIVMAFIGNVAEKVGQEMNSGYAPVETFGDYDVDFESVPDDAVTELEVHVLKLEEENGITTLTYHCDGDIIKSWTQEYTTNVADTDEEALNQVISQSEALFAPYDFIEYSTTRDGDMMTETLIIKNADEHFNELVELQLVGGDLSDNAKVKYSITKEQYIAQGYTEVE